MNEPDFQPGDALEWRNRNHSDGQLTIRAVSFRGMQNNMCVVSFGLRADGTGEPNLYSVSPSELSRPVPAQQPKPPAPAREPEPIVPLQERRQSLAQAFDGYREAEDAVTAAQELLDRALFRLEKSQAQLREFSDMEQHHVDSLVHELKFMNGGSHPIADGDEDWLTQQRAQRDCAAAEKAYDQLARELSDVKATMSDREHKLHHSAAFVCAAVVERETMKLMEFELAAAELRIQLQAASYLWFAGQPIPVSPIQAKVLNEPPAEVREGIGERQRNTELRQRPFAELLQRLVSGEIDADLPWCVDDD